MVENYKDITMKSRTKKLVVGIVALVSMTSAYAVTTECITTPKGNTVCIVCLGARCDIVIFPK